MGEFVTNTTTEQPRLKRAETEVSGAAPISQFLEQTYGVRLRLKENRPRSPADRLKHRRLDIGPAAIEDICLPGDVESSPDPLGKVVVAWPSRGRIEGHCGGMNAEAGPDDVTLITQPDLPYFSHSKDVAVTTVLLEPAFVWRIAAGLPSGRAEPPIRFADFRPVDTASSRLWRNTVHYVKTCLLASDATATPLVLGEASRLLTVALLTAFPLTAGALTSPSGRTDDRPVLLRRAIDYMDGNAQNDVALGDVADAIHVTPRAVQYMFRKHLDVSPLQFLRQLRLHRARHDLMIGDRQHETVTSIAARWGFMHIGRFAVLYRQTYGESPHETLRR